MTTKKPENTSPQIPMSKFIAVLKTEIGFAEDDQNIMRLAVLRAKYALDVAELKHNGAVERVDLMYDLLKIAEGK